MSEYRKKTDELKAITKATAQNEKQRKKSGKKTRKNKLNQETTSVSNWSSERGGERNRRQLPTDCEKTPAACMSDQGNVSRTYKDHNQQ